eukprot:Protomagalhaensia_sp_Gyna_25__613@NODE_128_length_5025_cov_140_328319_g101_i0_p4_GENE_NODE_128_length_5025_cov_140_328319_g101_i0NODE_128_length_5025_cov_140_328319_g101_i0_p4_ORF_typecomplete_len255_score39_85_NODE_128_length_5025_cov_140_328319_g101_i010631827
MSTWTLLLLLLPIWWSQQTLAQQDSTEQVSTNELPDGDLTISYSSSTFVRGATARCDGPTCSGIRDFASFEKCMTDSTQLCYGRLSTQIFGRANDVHLCRGDVGGRVFYGFPNLPYARSQYFANEPSVEGNIEIGFALSAVAQCTFTLLPADPPGQTTGTCWLNPTTSAGTQFYLRDQRQQLVASAAPLAELKTPMVGLTALGSASNCGLRIQEVIYDGVRYTVDASNHIDAASTGLRLSPLLLTTILLGIGTS